MSSWLLLSDNKGELPRGWNWIDVIKVGDFYLLFKFQAYSDVHHEPFLLICLSPLCHLCGMILQHVSENYLNNTIFEVPHTMPYLTIFTFLVAAEQNGRKRRWIGPRAAVWCCFILGSLVKTELRATWSAPARRFPIVHLQHLTLNMVAVPLRSKAGCVKVDFRTLSLSHTHTHTYSSSHT